MTSVQASERRPNIQQLASVDLRVQDMRCNTQSPGTNLTRPQSELAD